HSSTSTLYLPLFSPATAPTATSTLSLHDALPISLPAAILPAGPQDTVVAQGLPLPTSMEFAPDGRLFVTQLRGQVSIIKNHQLRSEEHTSELQSLTNLVCRLLLEKKYTLQSSAEHASVQQTTGQRRPTTDYNSSRRSALSRTPRWQTPEHASHDLVPQVNISQHHA